jgi:hypothetical protein
LPDRSVQPDDNHRNYGAFLWGSAVSAQPTARQLVPRSSVWGLFNQVRDKSSTSSKINILTPKYRADRLASVVMWAPNKSSEPGGVMRHFKLGGRAAGLFGACIIASFSAMNDARADQGGVSFWLPGLFGSLAAALQQPGWSLTAVYYHTSVSADADVAKAREITIGRIPLTATANVSANLDARADLAFAMPTYTFATPVLGGQLTLGAIGIYGRVDTSLAGMVTVALATPLGTFPFARSDSISDSVTGFGDVWPIATLRWHNGVHNYMTYIAAVLLPRPYIDRDGTSLGELVGIAQEIQ